MVCGGFSAALRASRAATARARLEPKDEKRSKGLRHGGAVLRDQPVSAAMEQHSDRRATIAVKKGRQRGDGNPASPGDDSRNA